MNTMKMPGFTAENSLYGGSSSYAAKATFGTASMAFGSSTQITPAAFGRLNNLFPTIRCCSSDGHYCASFRYPPWLKCSCSNGFDGEPILYCDPPVAHQ